MKIQYFPDTDTLYLDLAPRPITDLTVINDNLVVDLDEKGKPVGSVTKMLIVAIAGHSTVSSSRIASIP